MVWFENSVEDLATKIKSFYKRKKKIFNRVYFYLGSVFSLIPIACIVGIITTGGISNFIERTKDGNSKVHNIPLNSQGSFTKEWPGGFFTERTEVLTS